MKNTRPRISLCMIVRNEAELLPRCLSRAAGVWDELCVVDTGSTDATLDLLAASGAKVQERAWDNDFSAARNASLEMATGDWVLFLDADEMITPELISQLRSISDDESVGAATVVMRNRMPHGHLRESRLLRFFRNDPSVRFEHRIHEDVSNSLNRMLETTGRKVVQLGGVVDHLGYVRETMSAKNKKARDQSMLEHCVRERPSDLYSWFKLLELARFWNDHALWSWAAAPALTAVHQMASVLPTAHFGGELVVLISQGLYANEPKAALAMLEWWSTRVMPSSALWLRIGELREQTSDQAGAKQAFLSCLPFAERLGNLQLATVRPMLGLARLAMVAGELSEAQALVQQALMFTPTDLEALVAAVSLERMIGGRKAIDRFAVEHVRLHGDTPELHHALGDEALVSGETERAVAELRRATGKSPSGPAAIRLAQALLAHGELQAARSLSMQLLKTEPQAALGVLVCDLVSWHDTSLEVDLDLSAASLSLRSWIDVLRLRKSRDLFSRFLNVMPAIEGLFPWLPEYMAAQG